MKLYKSSLINFSEMEMNQNKTKEDIDGSAPNETDDPNISPSTSANLIEYRVYPERWWLLSAVLLLNISNYAHWVAFPVVVKVSQLKKHVLFSIFISKIEKINYFILN